MSIFKDKVLLITGGTGSFGNAKVYKVMVVSLSGTMEEIYMAKEVIRK